MKFSEFLTERDDRQEIPQRNSLAIKPPPYGGASNTMQLYKSPYAQDKGLQFIVATPAHLHINMGEWWAYFEQVEWDGSKLTKTGKRKMLPLAQFDKLNGASLLKTEF